MPFYIRKSVSVGPFRFNLSKSGIGVSAGIKGLRIGTGPRGHYIHAGAGGLYYRSSIGGGRSPRSLSQPPAQPARSNSPTYESGGVEMIRVSSADVLLMEDARFTDILADLNAKQNASSMTTILGVIGGGLAFLLLLAGGANGLLAGLVLAAAGLALGAFLDSTRRNSVLMYDLENDARNAYEAMTISFDGLNACAGKWHVDAGGAVQDMMTWKRNAGATHIVNKQPTTFGYSLPSFIKSNINPPAIKSGKETLYFLPDFLLVVDGGKVGSVGYNVLSVIWQDSNFIEGGPVPSDAQVISYVWKHPNKSGGPDRRFANNHQIPVCRYEAIHLSSTTGLNELLEVSRTGVAQPFADAIKQLARVNGAAAVSQSLPRLA